MKITDNRVPKKETEHRAGDVVSDNGELFMVVIDENDYYRWLSLDNAKVLSVRYDTLDEMFDSDDNNIVVNAELIIHPD